MADMREIYKNVELFPLQKGTDTNLFINPKAVLDIAVTKVKKGQNVKAFLDNLTYDDMVTPVTEQFKDMMFANINKQLKGFVEINKTDPDSYSGQYDTRVPEGTIETFQEFSQLFNLVTARPSTTDRKSYILKYNLFIGGTVYDSIKGAAHRTGTKTPNEVGELVTLSRFDQNFDIEIDDMIENLYQRDYESSIIRDYDITWINEIDEALVAGDANSSYTVNDPATEILDGIEQILYTATGIYTDRNSNTKDVLMLKTHLIPTYVDINEVNSLSGGTRVTGMSALTGAQIFATFEKAVELRNRNKWLRKGMKNKDIVIAVDHLTYDKYSKYRATVPTATTASPNATREAWLQNGIPALDHYGIKVMPMENMTGTFAIMGNLKDIYVVYSRHAEGSKMYREYEPELTGGGSGYHYNRYLYLGLGIKNRGNFILMGTGASADIKCKTPEIVSAWDSRATNLTGTTTASAATQTVYVYSTTKDAKIYYTLDGSTPDDTDTELTLSYDGMGGTVDVDDGETLKVIAYKAGVLDPSTVATYAVSSS